MAERALTVWENTDNWLNCAQVARMLRVNQATLSKHIQRGHISYVKLGLGKGILLLPPVEILRLAAAYGRVKPEEVKRDLARIVATRNNVTEEELVEGLDQLSKGASPVSSDISQARSAQEGNVMGKSTHRGDVREVDLGRMRPERANRDDIPAESTVRSFDSIRPVKRHVVIETRGAKEVDLGRMRPGRKY
ncbi:MAG: hypothetical protein M1358_04475 [Chloroflexi bacterium]|nr:hypothetical protein [Chloroflexota bacterium]